MPVTEACGVDSLDGIPPYGPSGEFSSQMAPYAVVDSRASHLDLSRFWELLETNFPLGGPRGELRDRLGSEIVSDLPLQMCLFFNVCYFPFWLAVEVTILCMKYLYLNYLYKFILITVLVAVLLIEVTRLYLGYLGNLTEKVHDSN